MRRLGGLRQLMHREPVAMQGLIQATLAFLVGFGVVNWTNEQVGLALGLVAAGLALFTRTQVSPNRADPPVGAQQKPADDEYRPAPADTNRT